MMVARCVCFVAVLLGCSIAAAAAPKAVINGPVTATAGELLVLDASQSTDATSYLWRVTPDVPGRKMFSVCGAGEKIHIASMPGTYTYALVVSNADGADLLFWTVTIPGSVPGPTPVPPAPGPAPPGPGPQPEPLPVPPAPPAPDVVPDGPFGIAREVYRLALQVQSPTRAAEAGRLADVFRRAREAKITGLTSTTLAMNMAKHLNEAKPQALGASEALWDPIVTVVIAKVRDAFAAGKLAKSADYDPLFLEIESALRAAAK